VQEEKLLYLLHITMTATTEEINPFAESITIPKLPSNYQVAFDTILTKQY
jgi:hypothetical protein